MNKLKNWFMATRFPFLTVTIFPVLASMALLYRQGIALDGWGITGLLAATIFGHLGANCLNDYADWNESDRINQKASPFNGGSRFLLGKVMKQSDFLYLSLFFFTLTAAIWVFFSLTRGAMVFWVGLAGILCGILYSQKPFSFQKRGLGEILILLAFGPVLTLAAASIFGAYSLAILLLGAPFGIATLNIIFLNEIPDREADIQAGKKTWVVRLGEERARKILPWLHGFIYLSLVVLGLSPWFSLLFLFSILPLIPFSFLYLRFLKKGIIEAQKGMILFQQIFGLVMTLILLLGATP